uniref:DNA damage-regulated autophagy modulator protein 2 n=1 Tax=Ditylenchus dipsaci TaxID=166011 RepID=A0A915DAJ7_9BILA
MGLDKVWIVPLATFIFTISAFVISYPLAVAFNHVTPLVPYISDAGSFAPESCIFGQLLNMAALFLALTIYLRHRQIVEFYWHKLKQEGRWRRMSCLILWIGYSSAFGEYNVLYIHYAGAFLAFGFGLAYAWAQTVLTYQMCPKLAEPIVYHCRLSLCIFSSVFFATTIVCGPILGAPPSPPNGLNESSDNMASFHDKRTVTNGPNNSATNSCITPYLWTKREPNYGYHVIGTTSEWLLAICFQLYILSFAIELRHAYCHAPKLRLVAFKGYGEKRRGITNTAVVKQTPVIQLFGLDTRQPETRVNDGGTSHYIVNSQILPNGVNPSYIPDLENLSVNTLNVVQIDENKQHNNYY